MSKKIQQSLSSDFIDVFNMVAEIVNANAEEKGFWDKERNCREHMHGGKKC